MLWEHKRSYKLRIAASIVAKNHLYVFKRSTGCKYSCKLLMFCFKPNCVALKVARWFSLVCKGIITADIRRSEIPFKWNKMWISKCNSDTTTFTHKRTYGNHNTSTKAYLLFRTPSTAKTAIKSLFDLKKSTDVHYAGV